jgi:hypothetical protein
MTRPSEPVEYLFRFHLHETPDDLWHELTFKWKLSLEGAIAKIQQVVYNRFGQYDHIDSYTFRCGVWNNVHSLWWFPARPPVTVTPGGSCDPK